MSSFATTKKQKLSLDHQYKMYLSKGPKPQSELTNKYNLLDDLNIIDKAMIDKARNYILNHTKNS